MIIQDTEGKYYNADRDEFCDCEDEATNYDNVDLLPMRICGLGYNRELRKYFSDSDGEFAAEPVAKEVVDT